jgi:hypothetical protein
MQQPWPGDAGRVASSVRQAQFGFEAFNFSCGKGVIMTPGEALMQRR